jgi:hypothetical protein
MTFSILQILNEVGLKLEIRKVVLVQTKRRSLILIVKLLHSLNLQIHTDKTQITNFDRGFRFLGHGFVGNGIFPLDSPKEQSKSPKAKKKHPTPKSYNQKPRQL